MKEYAIKTNYTSSKTRQDKTREEKRWERRRKRENGITSSILPHHIIVGSNKMDIVASI